MEQLGCVHYHNYEVFVDDKALAFNLKEREKENIYIALFLVTILRKIQYKYIYGRGVVIERYENEKIHLPIDKKGKLDWNFMENYIKLLPYSDKIY